MDLELRQKITQHTGSEIVSVKPVAGGCISDAFKLEMESGSRYFLKLNYIANRDLFPKEANGLIELGKPAIIRIPKVILSDCSFILMEFIESGAKTKSFAKTFGRKFAELHKFKGRYFGFYEDNYIGSNVQRNIPGDDEKEDWVNFFFTKRLLAQYTLAEKNDFATPDLTDGILEIEKRIYGILNGSAENPCLLHGDLWSGNYMVDDKGNPVLSDPAVYYGHREADLAMTKLFGGFRPEFYSAYNEVYPLTDGYEYREDIYKLYHLLNHMNLFGKGYYNQVMDTIRKYTS
ncbi:MAG: fructosamine kinase family protein [Ignavibacteriaceae bacterium]|nr:fructosamine kinase family protein [Ignavibacteriaceae bacterium]